MKGLHCSRFWFPLQNHRMCAVVFRVAVPSMMCVCVNALSLSLCASFSVPLSLYAWEGLGGESWGGGGGVGSKGGNLPLAVGVNAKSAGSTAISRQVDRNKNGFLLAARERCHCTYTDNKLFVRTLDQIVKLPPSPQWPCPDAVVTLSADNPKQCQNNQYDDWGHSTDEEAVQGGRRRGRQRNKWTDNIAQ